MPNGKDSRRDGPTTPGAQDVIDTWRRFYFGAVDAAFANLERSFTPVTPEPFDRQAPMRAFSDFASSLLADPAAFAAAQQKIANQWAAYFNQRMAANPAGNGDAGIVPERGDRRFRDAAWSDEPYFRTLKEVYLLTAKSMMDLVESTKGLDPKTRTRIDFFLRQFLYAASPTNFPSTNPQVVRRTYDTFGLNLLGGLANFLTDYAHPNAWVQRRTDDDFVLGKDLATTPGAVIFQNDLFQLIQYAPTTAQAYRRPILYVPPLVNKYYMMDLTPASSMFRWLVDQGHTVFTISWANPDDSHQDQDLSDYVVRGVATAVDTVLDAMGEDKLDIYAFCIGGALSMLALSYMSAKGTADKVASATVIGAMVDYEDMREWSTFMEREHLEAFQNHIEEQGMIAGDDLGKLFSIVRANDLIWNSVVDHYLLDKKAPPSDLLHWFADSANMTKAFLRTWSIDVLDGNKIPVPGAMEIDGTPVDLSAIQTPIINIALKEDHVSAWEAVFKNGSYLGGPVTFVLGGSGHNAGVINPPARNKHGYWLNDDATATDPDAWLAGATKHEGSWWPQWHSWITTGDLKQTKVKARPVGSNKYPRIEMAPGSYVRT